MDLKTKIVGYSKEIGIDLIGFMSAEPLEELRGLLNERKEKNYLSGFEEKDINKRLDPKLTFSEAKTIIVIGVSYNIKENKHTQIIKGGKISTSAFGIDYHLVLKNKMEMLSEYIGKKTKCFKYQSYVDTGPLVDRHLAYKSGIGFYGKNNCIISEKYGSWIFIGYIICNLDIKSDKPQISTCASCNMCIESCPTGALMDGRDYNAKKCISYLTQTKDNIDYYLREKMGRSIYGCDICQSVCPHNKNVLYGQERAFVCNESFVDIDLINILELSNKQFKELFGKTAAGWRGKNIIKRNALIAIGNSRDVGYMKHLIKYLNHDSILIRKYTAWSILKLDKSKGKEILDKHIKVEKNEEVIKEIKNLYKYYLKK